MFDPTLLYLQFHQAIKDGDLETFDRLLNQYKNMPIQNLKNSEFKYTLLHTAAQKGDSAIIQRLLDRGLKVNEKTSEGVTPLHFASDKGHDKAVQFLIDKGADVNAKTLQDATPLHFASDKGHDKTVQLLIDKGADVNAKTLQDATPLHSASEKGHGNVVELLIKNGADINAKTSQGATPLYIARQNRHDEVVQLLIAASNASLANSTSTVATPPLDGIANASRLPTNQTANLTLPAAASNISLANSTVTASSLYSQFYWAIENGDLTAFDTLLNQHKNIPIQNLEDDRTKATLLHIAAGKGHFPIAQRLLNKGVKVNAQTLEGATPLHFVGEKGHYKIAQLLIKNGANVNAQAFEGWTPLHSASRNGDDNVVQLLLENGANIDATILQGATPLHLASEKGHYKTAQLLIKNGANVNAQAFEGWTPLHSASRNGDDNVVQLLLENSANVDATILQGWTPLHMASDMGHYKTAQLLLENGANVNEQSLEGWTPLGMARHHKHGNIVQLLVAASNASLANSTVATPSFDRIANASGLPTNQTSNLTLPAASNISLANSTFTSSSPSATPNPYALQLYQAPKLMSLAAASNVSLANSTTTAAISPFATPNAYALQLYQAPAPTPSWTDIVLETGREMLGNAAASVASCGTCLLVRDMALQQGLSPKGADLCSLIATIGWNAHFAYVAYSKGAGLLMTGLPPMLSTAVSQALSKINLNSAVATTVCSTAFAASISALMGTSTWQAIGQVGVNLFLNLLVSKSEKWFADRYLTGALESRLKELGSFKSDILKVLSSKNENLKNYLNGDFQKKYNAIFRNSQNKPSVENYVQIYKLEQELKQQFHTLSQLPPSSVSLAVGPDVPWDGIEAAELQQRLAGQREKLAREKLAREKQQVLQAQEQAFRAKLELEQRHAKWLKNLAREDIYRDGTFCDPVLFEIMRDPVMLPCGHNFERNNISEILNHDHICPVCKQPANAAQLFTNLKLRNKINVWLMLKAQNPDRFNL